jgi:serine/threonine-protein kinase
VPAYEAFLRARYFLNRATPEALLHAKDYLEQAITLDPDFAPAHSGVSSYFQKLAALGCLSARQALPQARAAAQRALEIDPSLAEAHAELAAVAIFLDYDWAEAGRWFQLAMARDPVPAIVSHLYGFFYLLPQGRVREATEALERALREDPLNLQCRTQLAVCYWTEGRIEEACRQFRQALELDENYWLALLVQGVWHAQAGRLAEALALAQRAYTVAPKKSLQHRRTGGSALAHGRRREITAVASGVWRRNSLPDAHGLAHFPYRAVGVRRGG